MQFLPGHIALHDEARSFGAFNKKRRRASAASGSRIMGWKSTGAPSGKSKALPSRFFRFRLPVDRAVTDTALDTVPPHVGQLGRAVRIR
jgi:hypothetical protein